MPRQPSECRTKYWVEINDNSCGIYDTNSQIKSKALMLKSNLCDIVMHTYMLKEL